MSPSATELEELWDVAGRRSSSARFRSAEVGIVTPQGPVLIAVRDDGTKHLLVPVDPKHTIKEDLDGRAVSLRRTVLEDETSLRTYAALGLVDDALSDLFTTLCAEVLTRVSSAPHRALPVLRRALDEWRALLSGARRALGPAEQAGLFGELLILKALVTKDPGAVVYWTGHTGTSQDFHRGKVAVEVKTTTSVEGRQVRIHGVEQLDTDDSVRLLLVWMRVSNGGGRSLPDLIDEITELVDDPPGFVAALREVGYAITDREVYSRQTFELVEQAVYEIGAGFPRITTSDLSGDAALAGLDNVHYDLDLNSPPASSSVVDVDPARALLELL
ncbi:PD-(D/E)XK motif protein [Actinomycetospora sp. OC33-EN08]|uniref:PD-(D/E)XK motif protein n=1 Tax=Actinomycetospora aurantiaca TaxID=3129233 RepID=A0ABU8MHB9_9PSEU